MNKSNFPRYLWKQRRTFTALLLMASIFISIGANLSQFNMELKGTAINEINLRSSDNLQVDDPWFSSADNKTVNTYIQNTSILVDQVNSFNITAPAAVLESKIHSANLSFNFESNYNTSYVIEDDSPLDYPVEVFSSRENSIFSDTLNIEIGNNRSGGIVQVSDSEVDTFASMNDTATSLVINYTANFSTVGGFNRSNIVGFRFSFDKILDLDVIAQLYLWNSNNSQWDLMKDGLDWSKDRTIEQISVENSRLMYFDAQNLTIFKLKLTGSIGFWINFYEIEIEALTASEISFTDTNQVALEFDLMGDSTVYGFYAWIRTLYNLTVPDANLTISLYRANQTATRTVVTDINSIALEPGIEMISTRNITGYTGDAYQFIPFKSDYSGINLNISNYFIVIHSNASGYYSLVTIPWDGINGADPDESVDHLLLVWDDSESTWGKPLSGVSPQLDAAPFALNLTRPWKPDDIDLKIDNQSVFNKEITTGIYENTSPNSWGLGGWNHLFDNEIEDVDGDINIELSWNTSLTASLQFNVTYDAVIYSIENAISTFNISYGQQAYWELNYSLDQGKYTNWILKNFSFEIPINWSVGSNYLFDSNGTDLSLNGTHTYNEELNYYWVDFETIIAYSGNGNYTLNCYSLNYIYEMDSFLHYNNEEDYRWKTKAIMPGDNMSVNLIIQNFANQDSVVSNGNAVCELFDIDGNKVNYATLTDTTVGDNATGSDGQYLSIYEFDGLDILNTTDSTEKGAYNLVFKWNNGEEVGYDIWPVYLTDFRADIVSITVTGASYDEDEMINLLQAYIYKNSTDVEKFNPYVFSLNETSADYIPLNPAFSEEVGYEFNESGVWLNITSFEMNETLINPGEGINIDVTVKSFNNYFGNYYKLGITFVQSINEEWQVMSQNSTEFFINETGGQEDEKNINFVFDVPSDDRGINAPLRQNPFKINITLWIKSGDKFIDLGDFQIGSAFPFVNYTENQLEGIILDYVHSEKSTSANPAELYLKELSRSETILPGTTKYILQLVDKYYISTKTTDVFDFDSKLIPVLSDIQNNEINWGKDFDLSGYLVDETGNPIEDKNIDLYFMGVGGWEVFNQAESSSNQLLTDENGYFTGTFSSTVIPKTSSLEVNLTWDAESETDYESVSIAQTLNLIQFNSTVSITLVNTTDNPYLTKGFVNNFQFNIINSGNSTLTDISITIAIDGISSNIDFDFKNDSDWNFLEYNETVSIVANVFIPISYQGGELLITLNVSGKSHESAESYNSNFGFSMVLLDYSSDNFNIGIVVIMLLGIIGVWTAGFFYSKRIYGKLQVVPEAKTKKKRRRYIDVSKLSKGKKTEEGKKIETKATEDVSEQDPRTADLDELLKEEGLDESKE